ncbi:2-C-methyl-D-erythritol 2,4-cyclodiphosphate synthase [Mycobacteroides abscessus subsp. abscessus]|nr:2-C-methyl-D-erythritol 2,4-cyclodiphosphate synthase [Mycobacteroides abscessus subsp. abscessus]
MVRNIAEDLRIPASSVNVKAKTNESLGYLGRKEGIAATVVAMIARKPDPVVFKDLYDGEGGAG